MDRVRAHAEYMKAECRKVCKMNRHLNIFLSLLVSILFPLYETIYFGWLKGYLTDDNWKKVWIGITIGVIGLHCILVFRLLFARGKEELLNFVELQCCIDEHEKLQQRYETMEDAYDAMFVYTDVARNIACCRDSYSHRMKSGECFNFTVLNNIFERFENVIPTIFQLDKDWYYNFSIYLYNPRTKRLECKYVTRDLVTQKVKTTLGRPWGTGQGHIGKCFSNDVGYIDPDITTDPMFSVVNNNPEDKKYYRSAISVPLRGTVSLKNGKKVKQIYGVMLLTCSKPDKLSKVAFGIMLNLQSLLEEFVWLLEEDGANA